MKTLYIIRHGDVNYETQEYSLSQKGIEESSKLGKWFKESNLPMPKVIISSDRPRAVQTAQTFAGSLGFKLQLEEEIRETERKVQFPLDLYENFNTSDSNEKFKFIINNEIQETNPPPGIEQKGPATRYEWSGQKERIQEFLSFLDKISGEYETTAIFSHANIISLSLQHLFSETLDLKTYGTGCMTSSFTILTKLESKWIISKLFSLSHLK